MLDPVPMPCPRAIRPRRRPHGAGQAVIATAVALLAIALPAAPAVAAPTTLSRGELRGWVRGHASTATVRAELAAGSRAGRRSLRRSSVAASGFRRGSRRLLSGAVDVHRPAAARTALRRWTGARHAKGVRQLGDRAARTTTKRGRTVRVTVAWRRGGRIGLLRLEAHGAVGPTNELAVAYARLADRALRETLPRRAWDRVLQQIRPDGSITKATALRAFSVAYGRLPGVPRPTGVRASVPSGTLAVQWILRYRSTLTRAQRRVVDRALGLLEPAKGGHSIQGTLLADANFTQDDGLTAVADHWAQVIGGHLGMPLTTPIIAGDTKTNIDSRGKQVLADATPVQRYGLAGERVCRIRVSDHGRGLPARTLRVVMAHEVFHCFEFQIDAGWTAEPPWIIEGMASWAALEVEPFDGLNWVGSYAGSPATPLFERSYDAAGFFGHAVDVEGSLWSRVPTVLRARTNVERFAALGGEGLLSTWASSVVRSEPLGPEWVMRDPVGNPVGLTAHEKWTGTAVLGAKPYTLQHSVFEAAPERPIVNFGIEGHWRATWPGRSQYADQPDIWFCASEDPGECTCRDDEDGKVPATQPLNEIVWVAVTGDPGNGSGGSIVSYRREDFCRPKDKGPKPRPRPIPRPRCNGSGCGRTNGDPHLGTFDGASYDFQAAGEYTLADSTTDGLLVQARQEPWRDSRYVAIDTAVAMRVGGATVEVDKGMDVRVDGDPVRLAGGRQLGLKGGGAVERHDEDVAVRWPDGTVGYVWAVGDYGVAFALQPAAGRAGRLRGLLGDFDGNPDDDFVGRDGTRYPAAKLAGDDTSKSAFRALYDGFGRSWRVGERTSLFHYPKGKGPDDYLRKGFPSRFFTIDMLSPAKRAAAEKICRAKGITDEQLLEECILDVAITGRKAFASSAGVLADLVERPLAGGWTPLGDGVAATDVPAVAADGGGISVAYPAPGASALDVASFAPSAGGIGGVGHVTAFGGWQSVGDAVFLPRPGGGVQLLADGFRDGFSGTASSARGADGSFAPPVGLAAAYEGLGRAGVLASDGAPLVPTTFQSGLSIVHGDQRVDLSGAVPGFSYAPALAFDGGGRLWLSWYEISDEPGRSGVYLLQIDPASGGPAAGATAQQAPGSGGQDNNSGQRGWACAALCRVVYVDGARTAGRLVSWAPGEATATTIARASGNDPIAAPAAAYASDGRFWVTWIQDDRRLVATLGDDRGAGGRQVQVDPPVGASRALATVPIASPAGLVVAATWATAGGQGVQATVVPPPATGSSG